MPTRISAITAIIRKDLELLWPLALSIIVLQLGVTLFLHEVTEFPGASLPTDRPFLNARNPIFWVGVGVPPVLSAIFVLVAVQTDAATDRHHDWLTRPVGALEIATAKIMLVLSVVFLPFALGTIVFTLVMQADPQLTLLPVAIMLRNCLFGVLLAWLVSSMLQATIAMIGLMTTTAFLTAIITAIGTAIYVAIRNHAGLAAGETAEQTVLAEWPRILAQLAAQIAIMWPVLWLLLERRKVTTARLVFAGAYLLVIAFPFAELRRPPPRAAALTPIIHLTPSGETRHA